MLRGLIERYNICCDLRSGILFAALTDRQAGALREHQRSWERCGHRQLTLHDARATRARVGTRRYRATLPLTALDTKYYELRDRLGI